MDSRFDDLLHTVIVQKGQGIYGFFDVVFGFMYRRTDFFYEMAPGENMGFFPTQAEALVYNYFRKYQNLHYKERVPKRQIDPKEIEEHMKKMKEKKEGITGENSEKVMENSNLNLNTNITPDSNTDKKTKIMQDNFRYSDTSTEIKLDTQNIIEKESDKIVSDKNDKIAPPKVQPISTYNGDSCDNYNWSQGVKDVTIQVSLPEGTNKKMLKVEITNTNLRIYIKSNSYFDAEFGEKIISDESNWSLEDNKNLILFLEKSQEVIWKSAFKGHKEIDTKKVDNSKRIDEFDNDTQAALNKIVYEQNRKKNGLLTTEEEKKMNAMKEAWNAEGSPFKGQPFDPSMFSNNMNEPIYFNTPDYEAKLRAKSEK